MFVSVRHLWGSLSILGVYARLNQAVVGVIRKDCLYQNLVSFKESSDSSAKDRATCNLLLSKVWLLKFSPPKYNVSRVKSKV
jgi:hypothetical protein